MVRDRLFCNTKHSFFSNAAEISQVVVRSCLLKSLESLRVTVSQIGCTMHGTAFTVLLPPSTAACSLSTPASFSVPMSRTHPAALVTIDVMSTFAPTMVCRGFVESMDGPPVEVACGHAEDINEGDEEYSIIGWDPYSGRHDHAEYLTEAALPIYQWPCNEGPYCEWCSNCIGFQTGLGQIFVTLKVFK